MSGVVCNKRGNKEQVKQKVKRVTTQKGAWRQNADTVEVAGTFQVTHMYCVCE